MSDLAPYRLVFPRGVANLTVRVDPSMTTTYHGEFYGPKPRVTEADGVVSIDYSQFNPFKWGRTSADVRLSPTASWAIEVRGGVSHWDSDLRTLELTAIEVRGGVNKVELRLPRPRGSSIVRVSGGASHLTLRRPAGVPARLEIGGGASKLELPELDAAELQTDAQGFLFDPRVREVLKRQGRKVEPGTEALAAVRILGKKLHASMERWTDRFGLSEGRFQILVRLHHQPSGRFTMGELAEMLDITPRTVTGLVDNLERDGLVRRVADPADRRSVYAEITDQGRDRVNALWREAAGVQATLTHGLKDSELIQLRHLCLRLIQALGVEEGKTHATR